MKKAIVLSVALLTALGNTFAEDLHPESERVVEALRAEIWAASKGPEKQHPCVAFSQGGKDASYAVSMLLALSKATSRSHLELEDLGIAALPFAHSLMHYEAKSLNDHPILKWLASNWTTLGLAAIIGQYSSSQDKLNQIVRAIYAQYALAIAAAKLELDQSI